MYYQHGDVILYKINNIENVEKMNKIDSIENKYILANGEITSHAHCIEKENVQLYMDSNNEMYVDILESTDLRHIDIHTGEKADHNTIIVPPGKYQIGRVKEYDPFEKEIREVQD